MAWITPKTDWVDGDYFNLNPDYSRIKGNIEHLIALSQEMYAEYDSPTLETAEITGYPRVSFFNNVVNSVRTIAEMCFSPSGFTPMRLYASNGVGWSAAELNAIEGNILLLYLAFTGQKAGIQKLSIKLGGKRIGG